MANLLSTGTGFAGLWGPNAILTASGSPVVNTPVTVYQSDGVTLATLYTNQTRAIAGANPINTDSFGNLSFYASPGIYILSFNVGGVVTTNTIEVQPWYTDGVWNVVGDTAVSGGSTFSPLSGDLRSANATSGNITYNLPGNPSVGMAIAITRTDSTNNTVTVSGGTRNVQWADGSYATSLTFTNGGGGTPSATWVFDGSAWRCLSATQQLPLSALAQSSATSGQVPVWNGSAWAPSSLTGAPGTTVQSYITADVTGSGGPNNITSVSLAAGTWLVTARAFVDLTAAGNSDLILGPTSASLTGAYAAMSISDTSGAAAVPVSLTESITVASTTTVYLMIDSVSNYTVRASSKAAGIGNQSGITAVQTA